MNGGKLYVGNLTYAVTGEQLRNLFAEFGEVKDARVIEGKGFGFVEMAAKEGADKAKQELNGKEFEGRALRIDDARPQKDRPHGRGHRR
ncbi:MAG: rbp [Deltaproteobacteria bacterium]|nr:rbp [Deltaproteobacteria bacterium]